MFALLTSRRKKRKDIMLEFARTLIKRLGKRLIDMFNMKNFNWNSLGHSIVTETVLTLVVCLVTVAVMKTVGA